MIPPTPNQKVKPCSNEEGILYGEVVRGKFNFDVVGNYARPDVFQLMVDEEPMLPIANS